MAPRALSDRAARSSDRPMKSAVASLAYPLIMTSFWDLGHRSGLRQRSGRHRDARIPDQIAAEKRTTVEGKNRVLLDLLLGTSMLRM